MKKALASVLMLISLLTSMLSVSFIVKPSLAENSASNVPYESFLGSNQSMLSKETENSQIVLDKNLSSLGQNSSYEMDRWDFNDTSEWYNFTYRYGDKTRLIVGVKGENSLDLAELSDITVKHEAKIVSNISIRNKVRAAVVELSLRSILSFVDEVRNAGLASYIEPNMKVQVQFEPNDPYWDLQWGPHTIKADWAWNITIGDPSILVAVVDTGANYTHPDIADNYVP